MSIPDALPHKNLLTAFKHIIRKFLKEEETVTGFPVEGVDTEVRMLLDGSPVARTEANAFGNWQVENSDMTNNRRGKNRIGPETSVPGP